MANRTEDEDLLRADCMVSLRKPKQVNRPPPPAPLKLKPSEKENSVDKQISENKCGWREQRSALRLDD
jgi:hypothetical protein